MHTQKELFWFYFQIYRWKKNYIILLVYHLQWSFYTTVVLFIFILFHWFVVAGAVAKFVAFFDTTAKVKINVKI